MIALYVGLFSCDGDHGETGDHDEAGDSMIALYVGLFSCDLFPRMCMVVRPTTHRPYDCPLCRAFFM